MTLSMSFDSGNFRQQTPNFADANNMLSLFEENETPLRGHVVFWSVDGHSPDWYEAMTDLSQKEQIALDWVDEVIGLYKNKLVNWDVFNVSSSLLYDSL